MSIMDKDFIDYGKLVDEAMHIIVCKVLKLVQDKGLPGNHHFFISFLTRHPKVAISEALKRKYPKEMTVVMQYQYQDLKVDSYGFGVTLSFGGKKEEVYIPYSAITTFADPSVQFGLQFRENMTEDEPFFDVHADHLQNHVRDDMKSLTNPLDTDNNVITLDRFRHKKK